MPILYQAPVMLEEHHFSDIVCRELNLNDLPAPDMTEWNEMLARIENRSRTVRIALVGKYVQPARRLSFRCGSSAPRRL